MPLVNFAGINGKGLVPIVGFAEMYVVSVDPGSATVSGYMIQALPNNGIATNSPCTPGSALPVNSCTPVLLE